MCYGTCPLERPFSGECRGPADFNDPRAACRTEEVETPDDFEPDLPDWEPGHMPTYAFHIYRR